MRPPQPKTPHATCQTGPQAPQTPNCLIFQFTEPISAGQMPANPPQVQCFGDTSDMTLISPEPILRIHAELADILHFGATPIGERRVINILGGTVTGKLN